MPQLNPDPWFFTMLISWSTFLLILQPKLSSFTSTNSPSSKTTHIAKTTSWNWPWT